MATESSFQREQVAEQELPVCDACREYECKVQLPGEFRGKYRKKGFFPVGPVDGNVCILHYTNGKKDVGKCGEAVEKKKQQQK